MRRESFNMHANRVDVICSRCDRKLSVAVFPLRCSCGLVTYEDGSTSSLHHHQLGDVVSIGLERLGIRKRPGCGCERRKQRLNRWGRYLARQAHSAATWLHPR